MKILQNDLKYMLAAAMLAASLLPAGYGIGWTWYIGIAYLGFNSAVMMLASGVLMNPDVFTRSKKADEKVYRNPMLQFLVQVLTAAYIYGLYNAGFVFTSGFFLFMLGISFMSNLMVSLATSKDETQ